MILLLSGGIDSFVAYHYLGKPKTIYFDLQTPYTEKEIEVVKKMDPNIIIDKSLSFLGATQEGKKAFVPYRNLYLAMRASSYDDVICIAGIKGDDVSDKNEQAFVEFSALLSKLVDRKINVVSPFWQMTKEQIVSWYLHNVEDQLDLVTETVSCYSEEATNYCGSCPSCFRKWAALVNNGIHVPFHNFDLLKEYMQSAKEHKYIPERNNAIISAIKSVYNYE